MGNAIPHGDRLHECDKNCPEFNPTPLRAAVYTHPDDGRRCILGPDGIWRHWDLDHAPSPRETVDWQCRRDHPLLGVRHLTEQTPVEPDDYNPASNDRGEFGMPTLGRSMNTINVNPVGLQFGLGSVFITSKHDYKYTIEDGMLSIDYGENGENYDAMTPEAAAALKAIGPLLMTFLKKNAQYARAQSHDLGVKGIIPDVNRKTSALITRFWDRDSQEPMPGEDSSEELIGDLFGHLLLMLGKLAERDG